MTTVATATTAAPATAQTPAPAAPAPAPAPSNTVMIHAIKQVQTEYAAKIGAACVLYESKKGTPSTPAATIVSAEFEVDTQMLAGLELARGLLEAAVEAGV